MKFAPTDLVSILAFLVDYRNACDANIVNEGTAIHTF